MSIKSIKDIGGDHGRFSGPQGVPVKVDLGAINSSISSQNSVSNTLSSMINREASAVQNAVNKVSDTVNNSIYPGVGQSVGSAGVGAAGARVADSFNSSIVQNAGSTVSANVTSNIANAAAGNAVGTTSAVTAGATVANNISSGVANNAISQGVSQSIGAVESANVGAAGMGVAQSANASINQTIGSTIALGAVESATVNTATGSVIDNAGRSAIVDAVNGSVQGVARSVANSSRVITSNIDTILSNPDVRNGMYVIGFNPEQATTLLNQLVNGYNDTIISIRRYFEGLFNTLVQNWKAPEARTYYTTILIPSCTNAFQNVNSFYTNLYGRVTQAISLWLKTTNSTLNIANNLVLMPVPNFEDKIPSNLETGDVIINNNLLDMVRSYNLVSSSVYKTVMKDAYNKISSRTAFLGSDQQQSFIYEMGKMNTKIDEIIASVTNAAIAKTSETLQKYQQVAQSIASSFSNALGGKIGIQ